MDREALKVKPCLSVHEAALLLADGDPAVRDAERLLSHAIDRGELPASITRWATEQWAGDQLEGNIDRTRTLIRRDDLDIWLRQAGRTL